MVEPIVMLNEGKIKGIIGQNFNGKKIYKFLGLPYGKPPVGELRFKAPEPVEAWEGIKDATRDGDVCYQRDIYVKQENPNEIIGSEDCLVLNIFTHTIEPKENLKPVMVYIHGGGFTMGSNNSNIYGPEFLLMEDIVLVVPNYRLGILGFLSLEDDSLNVPGNAGLKDQTLALKWVQKNIKQFGGNPNNVTIFGESAGSAAVHFQVLSSSSKGLFHKAILQSGVALNPWALGSTNGSLIAEALGKSGATDQKVFDMLKKMTGKELFAVQGKIPDPMIFGALRPFAPVVEKENPTAFITKQPIELITSGDYNHVPLFIGYNSNEGILLEFLNKLIPNIRNLYSYEIAIPWFMNVDDEQRKKSVELMSNVYSKLKEPHNKHMLMMDSIMLSEFVASIINHCKTSKHPIYAYRVSVDCKLNFVKQTQGLQEHEGAAHADDLGFLFNIQELPKVEENTFEYLTVQRFIKLWTNFAKYGNPTNNCDFGVTLAPVQVDSITLLNIGKDLTILNDLPERDRMELWKNIFNLSDKTSNYLN